MLHMLQVSLCALQVTLKVQQLQQIKLNIYILCYKCYKSRSEGYKRYYQSKLMMLYCCLPDLISARRVGTACDLTSTLLGELLLVV